MGMRNKFTIDDQRIKDYLPNGFGITVLNKLIFQNLNDKKLIFENVSNFNNKNKSCFPISAKKFKLRT